MKIKTNILPQLKAWFIENSKLITAWTQTPADTNIPSEKLVKDNGGIVASGVSKTLSYLVTDDLDSSSSKMVKAKSLGIPMISSFQFADMLK